MANEIRLKRRPATGSAGAPSSLLNAEVAYNEADNKLYYGFGLSGVGTEAASIIEIAGPGAFVTLASNQTIAGEKEFAGEIDIDGGWKIDGTAVTATAAQLNYLSTSTSDIQVQINGLSNDVGNLVTLSGVAVDSVNLGTFTGAFASALSDKTVKNTIQALADEVEDGSGSLTADTGTADFENGTVSVLGGTGLSTTATGSALTVKLDDTAVTAAAYGLAASVPQVTFNAQGQATAAANVAIEIVHTQVSDFDAGVQANTLNSMAVPDGNVSMNSQRITNVADPVNDGDAVNKSYADALVSGLDVKDACRVATTAVAGNIALNNTTTTIDGVTLANGDRILVKNQTNGATNGIYVFNNTGDWDRSTDADTSAEVKSGMFTFIEEGTINSDSGFVLSTPNPITLGTTSLTFTHFSSSGSVFAGDGLVKTGNVLDVVTASSARIVVNANDIDLAETGIAAGAKNGLTIDAYGRATAFTQPTTLAGYSITDAQPLAANLTELAALTLGTNQLIYSDASGDLAMASLTAYGRSLTAAADAAAGRTLLGLGTVATQDADAVTLTGGTLNNFTIDGGTF